MNSVALTDAQIDSCRPALDQAWAAGRAGPRAIAIVAYADLITQPWQLGWSALLHRMPFILIGYGTPSKAGVWRGAASYNAPKVAAWFGLRRVVQLVRAAERLGLGKAAPRYLFMADGFDTLVVNPPDHFWRTAAAQRHAHHGAESPHGWGLLSGECNCWPRCLKDAYFNASLIGTRPFGQCVQRSPNCFLNAGLAMGTVQGWDTLLSILIPRLSPQKDEQLLLHEMWLEGALPGWEIDSQSEVLLSTLDCVGPNRLGALPKWSRCTTRAFSPLDHISPARDGGTAFVAESGAVQRPLVAHLQGSPTRTKAERFARFNHTLGSRAATWATAIKQPLLLIDSLADGPCKATTFGALASGEHDPGRARPHPLRR